METTVKETDKIFSHRPGIYWKSLRDNLTMGSEKRLFILHFLSRGYGRKPHWLAYLGGITLHGVSERSENAKKTSSDNKVKHAVASPYLRGGPRLFRFVKAQHSQSALLPIKLSFN
jgi:hypothetical protein